MARKYDPTYVGPTKTFKRLLDGRLAYYYRTLPGKPKEYIPRRWIIQNRGESEKDFFKRIKARKSALSAAATTADWARAKQVKEAARTWTNEWLTKNLNTYKPREVDRFLKDFKEDWAAEVKAKGYKGSGAYNPINRLGFPALSVHADKFKFKSMPIPVEPALTGKAFRKVFFENLLINNPEFKKGLDDYFDFFLRNKSGEANQFSGKLKLPQGAKDAVWWLSPESGVTSVGRTDMFAQLPAYSKIFREYQDKFNRGNDVNRQSIFLLEKKLGLPKRTLSNEMQREHTALKKLFDVKQLPQELRLGYSIEHTQGLAAAVKSDNPNILKAARRDLAGMTWRRNMDLGWGGSSFELTRKEYIKNIQDGLLNKKDMTKDIKNLNKIVSTEYKDIGAPKDIYSIKNNKLITSTISPATTPELRYAQYFSQLAKEKEGATALAHQMSPKNIEIYKPQLLDFIKKSPGNILMTIGKTLKCPVAGLGKAEGGRIGLAAGTSLINCISTKVNNDPIGSSQKISLIEESSGAMNKVKNVAKGFLGALGKFGPAAGKYGAIAAAGAIAQPLVKQFRNDDPSTYLTDPDQEAGMLAALLEGERPKPRSDILDWGTTAGTLGATAAAIPGTGALYRARRLPTLKRAAMGPLRAGTIGPAMKLLSGMFTPAGLMATEPLRIAQKRREGESWGDIATSPTTWMGPAFAPSMTRMATRGMNPSSLLPKLLRLGMSRAALAAMGPVGWAGLAASLGFEGYSQYQDYKKGRGFFASDED
jgi:hypothetical protein